MSATPSTSLTPPPPPPTIADSHLHPHQFLHHIHNAATSPSTSASLIREYRKGNWTLEETITLITAKKLDDERRLHSSMTSQNPKTPEVSRAGGEMKWKWIENYCWSHGCCRSQNQCNDKWDNLLRDYKRVREYEAKSESSKDFMAYWSMDKHQRKQKNLPSNMVLHVYEAINDVLQTKHNQRITQTQSLTITTPSDAPALPPPQPPCTQTSLSPELASESSIPDGSHETQRIKRRRRNVGSSILRSASVLAIALQSCEKKKDKRHREVMELERRRIEMEQGNRQGIANLVDAVTNLSGAIQSLISQRHGRRG